LILDCKIFPEGGSDFRSGQRRRTTSQGRGKKEHVWTWDEGKLTVGTIQVQIYGFIFMNSTLVEKRHLIAVI